MNFYDWWDQLTSKEQMLIGKNNAKFVWDQAVEVCAKTCEEFPPLGPYKEIQVATVEDAALFIRSRKS